VIHGTIELTRSAPNDPEGTAELLRITRFLYTYDAMSALNSSAVLCGAVVVPLMFDPYKPQDITFPFATLQDNQIFVPADWEMSKQNLRQKIDASSAAFKCQVQEFCQRASTYFSG
jgi:hypothetical protein